MKRILLMAVMAITMFNVGCSKDDLNPDGKTYLLKKLTNKGANYVVEYSYDDKNRVTLVNQDGVEGKYTYKFTYDANNKLIKEETTYPNMVQPSPNPIGTDTYLFTYAENSITINNQEGSTVATLSLNDKNQVISRLQKSLFSRWNESDLTEYGYDEKGNIISRKISRIIDNTIVSVRSSEQYQYDDKNHPLSKIGATYLDWISDDSRINNSVKINSVNPIDDSRNSKNYYYEYNKAGFPTKMSNGSGFEQTFEYIDK
ncbi:hypothetical protein C3K47_04115 [Solitalea longa]|uniref:DUF4595 domain-containing protein n=1 Tax=Solitalea longa TaxID=2079460 RepID=A0A2S5A7L6_9SPHI|nr:hypothetical protein [Solitalea longa]POY38588.1 hypothetical protein C3K47_04115 [Solitalea longa]